MFFPAIPSQVAAWHYTTNNVTAHTEVAFRPPVFLPSRGGEESCRV